MEHLKPKLKKKLNTKSLSQYTQKYSFLALLSCEVIFNLENLTLKLKIKLS